MHGFACVLSCFIPIQSSKASSPPISSQRTTRPCRTRACGRKWSKAWWRPGSKRFPSGPIPWMIAPFLCTLDGQSGQGFLGLTHGVLENVWKISHEINLDCNRTVYNITSYNLRHLWTSLDIVARRPGLAWNHLRQSG